MSFLQIVTLTLCYTLLLGQSSVSENPSSKPTTGRYRNFNYGFTTIIPKGLQAWWHSGPMWFDKETDSWIAFSDHGRTIPLGLKAEIVIYTGYNTDDTPSKALYSDIKSFQGEVNIVDFQIDFLGPFRLRNYRAMHYQAHKEIEGATVRREVVVAFTKNLSIEYVISLEGPEDVFKQHHSDFLAILRTWHQSPRQ